MPLMLRTIVLLALGLLVPATASRAGLEEYCSGPEARGEVLPSAACSSFMSIVGEVAAAAAPCWEQIFPGLPLDEWSAAREECEVQAHLAVCGHVPCY